MAISTKEKGGLHSGHRDRMRRRFLQHGFVGLNDHEVLELLLYYVVPRRDTNPIAHELINKYGSLVSVLNAPVEELAAEKFLSYNGAVLLNMFGHSPELKSLFDTYKTFIGSPQKVVDFMKGLLVGKSKEELVVVCLDATDALVRHYTLKGTINSVVIHNRELLQMILNANATGIIIGHNHPSGVAVPSQNDVRATKNLKSLLAQMGIKLYDHVILGQGGCFSFAVNGLFKEM